jgi:hypothetical protein
MFKQDARGFLPFNVPTKLMMTFTYSNLIHFIKERTNIAAQPEIRNIPLELIDQLGINKNSTTLFTLNKLDDLINIVETPVYKFEKFNGKPKEEIDKLCDYLVYLRNVASITAVLIQQINRDSQSMDRRKAGYYLIQKSDLADSSAPAQSAETILALFHPFREQLTTSCGYDITKLGDYCRILQCIKGRYGESDKAIGLSFYGSVGAFKQLPKPDQISDYERYKTIEFFMEKDEKKLDIEKPDKPIGYSFGDYPD